MSPRRLLFLRSLVRSLLREEAVGATQAVASGLALMDAERDGARMLVLYDPRSLDKSLREAEPTTDAVKGFIVLRVDPRTGFYAVDRSAAVKGYGPFMYDAALSLGKFVMPDEGGSVTPDAQRVWHHYATRRAHDVEIVPTAGRDHGVPWLDSAYRLRRLALMPGLRMRHKLFTSNNRRSRADLEQIIGALGWWLFNTRYKPR